MCVGVAGTERERKAGVETGLALWHPELEGRSAAVRKDMAEGVLLPSDLIVRVKAASSPTCEALAVLKRR